MPELLPIDRAIDAVLAAVAPLRGESVGLLAALGRTASEDIVSGEQVPSFDNSAMDGFAVDGAALAAGRTTFRVTVAIPAGRYVAQPVGPGAAAKIMTGAPLPPGVDTVVPVEQTSEDGDRVEVLEPVKPGEHVRGAGEDVAVGDTVVPRGSRLGPAEVGILASVGVDRVPVVARPRVAILATGSELVPQGQPVGPGQIRNSNSYTAYSQVLEAGGEPVLLGIARDDVDETRRLVAAALENDVVITTGGVSVGEFDFVRRVQEDLGVESRFWGVKTKPGKPLAFGVRGRTLVFGVPGNPVSAMVSFELYIRAALLAMQGRRDIYRPFLVAGSAEPVEPSKERAETRRCRLERRDGGWVFSTTGPQGSGILRSMTLADGLALVPPAHPGGPVGERLAVHLLEGSSVERPPYP